MSYKITIDVDLDSETANYLETCQRLSSKPSKLQLINPKILEFRKNRPSNQRNNRTFLDNSKKGLKQLIIRNLFWDQNRRSHQDVEQELKSKLSTYGAILKVYVHPKKPFGFVTFIDAKTVDKIMRRDDTVMQQIIFNKNTLELKRSLTKFQEDDAEFRGNFGLWLRVEGLGVPDKDTARFYFNSEVGEVEEFKIREITQTKKTYALVKFKHTDSIVKALIIKNHSIFGNSGQMYKVFKSDGSKANSHELGNSSSTPNTNSKRNRDGIKIQPPSKRKKDETKVVVKQEATDNDIIGYFGKSSGWAPL